jgi:hypothetical protein
MDNQIQPVDMGIKRRIFLKIFFPTLILILVAGAFLGLMKLKTEHESKTISDGDRAKTKALTLINEKQLADKPIENNPLSVMSSYDEIAKKYSSNVPLFYNLNGKVAYGVYKKPLSDSLFIVYEGKEIGREYDSAHSPAIVNGVLAYTALKDGMQVIVYGGEEIGKKYSSASTVFTEITDLNGKIGYIVSFDDKDKRRSFIVYDGKEFGKEYDYVLQPSIINGVLTYRAEKDGKWRVVYDGKEIHDTLSFPVGFEGKLAYTIIKNSKSFIIYDGKEIGKEYDNVGSPTFVNGDLAYLAKKDGREFIIYEGKEVGKEYDNVVSFTLIDGKLAYMVEQNNGKKFIVYDGKEFGKEYSTVIGYRVLNINDQLAFEAMKNDSKKIFLAYDKKEYPLLYGPDNSDNFTLAKTIGGSVFMIEKDNKIIVLGEK